MQVRTYVVQHDKGFAPNPFWGCCTLACCKPRIREKAQEGDIIIGFGSCDKRIKMGGRVIYWMKVGEVITFDEYWSDPRFVMKKPELGGSLMACYGDNIYHRKSGVWQQAYSFHSDGEGLGRGNLETDTGRTDRVLVASEFTYWGSAAPLFPDELKHLMPSYQAEPCRYSDEAKSQFLRWITSHKERGYIDEPVDWKADHYETAPFSTAKLERVAC